MKLFISAVMIFTFSACSGKSLPVPRAADPNIQFTSIDGSNKLLSEYQTGTVIVVFWAKWCRASVKLIKELDQKSLSNNSLPIIAVNLDNSGKQTEVNDFIKQQLKGNLIHMYSGNAEYDEAYNRLGRGDLPQILVIKNASTIIAAGTSMSVLED